MYKQIFRLTYVNNMSESHDANDVSKKRRVSERNPARKRRKFEMMRNRCSDIGEAGSLSDRKWAA
jgi:hypothetical protein